MTDSDASATVRPALAKRRHAHSPCTYLIPSVEGLLSSSAMSESQPESSESCGGSRRNTSQALQDLTSAKGFFTGCDIDYQRPCTSGEGRLCDIFRDLARWNEFFWQLCLELRELSPGELSLVDADRAKLPWNMGEKRDEAATLLWHLLSRHSCVVSVELNRNMITGQDELICDALRQSSSLMKLNIGGYYKIDKTTSYRLVELLRHLTQLRELQFRSLDFGYASSERLAQYLASTRSLRTLNMTGQLFKRKHGHIIVRGLKRNVTITTLSLSTSAVNDYKSRTDAFVAYVQVISRLRTLSVTQFHLFDELHEFIKPLLHNNTLFELNVTGYKLRIGDIQVIAALLIESGTLRSLNFITCFYERAWRDDADSRVTYTESFGNVSSGIHPWVVALTENKTLEELTFSLSWYDAEDWRSFFKALASNASLKKINVSEFPRKDVVEIYRAMRETGVQGRFVGVHKVFKDIAVVTNEQAEIKSTTLPAFEPLSRAACLMQSCSHVTSLCIMSEKDISNVTVSSLISQCFAGTMALRELEVICRIDRWNWYADHMIQRALLEGLSAANTLRSLFIWCLRFDDAETQKLADALQSSQTLYRFCFRTHYCDSPLMFLQKLSPVISSNYTLLDLHLNRSWCLGGDSFIVSEVVRRNNSLVTRASHFVMGTYHKHCAEAFELVRSTPGLVARVQSSASVDENEATQMIRRSFKNLLELDGFMRAVGVVKDSVTCYPRDDGKTQFADLNRDCWSHIRKFLKVRDILPIIE